MRNGFILIYPDITLTFYLLLELMLGDLIKINPYLNIFNINILFYIVLISMALLKIINFNKNAILISVAIVVKNIGFILLGFYACHLGGIIDDYFCHHGLYGIFR